MFLESIPLPLVLYWPFGQPARAFSREPIVSAPDWAAFDIRGDEHNVA